MPVENAIAEMTDEQFRQHTLSVISRELGLSGYARFLRLFCSGKGDYTAERHQSQARVTIEDLKRELLQTEHS